MTVAVCIQCGAIKHGALTACRDCGFEPTENEDKANSMIASDHFLSRFRLDAIASDIRDGQPITYPQDSVDNFIKLLEERPNLEAKTGWYVLGCLGVLVLLVISIVIAVCYVAG